MLSVQELIERFPEIRRQLGGLSFKDFAGRLSIGPKGYKAGKYYRPQLKGTMPKEKSTRPDDRDQMLKIAETELSQREELIALVLEYRQLLDDLTTCDDPNCKQATCLSRRAGRDKIENLFSRMGIQ